MSLKLFVDTMIFLHYRPLDELDLKTLTGGDEVSIVITNVLLHELDKHKSSHPIRKIRDRALRVLQDFEKGLDANESSERALPLEYFSDHSTEIIESLRLNAEWADHVLIGSIVDYREKNDNANVALLTQDIGPRLLCRKLAIQTFQLADEHALPIEVDAVEKENRKLAKELDELKRRQPVLEIKFLGTEEPFKRFELPNPPQVDDEELKQFVDGIREKYPKHTKTDGDDVRRRLSAAAALVNFNVVSPSDWQAYNDRIEEFYVLMEIHFKEVHEVKSQRLLIIPLRLEILNSGNIPADDVDVLLHFPDGFDLLLKDELPTKPEAPTAPRKPLTQLEKLAAQSVMPTYLSSFDRGIGLPDFGPPPTFLSLIHI